MHEVFFPRKGENKQAVSRERVLERYPALTGPRGTAAVLKGFPEAVKSRGPPGVSLPVCPPLRTKRQGHPPRRGKKIKKNREKKPFGTPENEK